MEQPPTSSTTQPQKQPSSTAEAAAKRQAYAGQWRTPPLPVFGSQQQAQQQNQQPLPQAQPNQQQQFFTGVPQTLPDSSEDYAKALQEAYRRGAEAAAAMATSGGATSPPTVMSTAVSCPNLAGHPEQQQQQQQHSQYSVEEPDPQVVSSQEAARAATLFLAEQQQQQQQEPPPQVPNPLQQAQPPQQQPQMQTTQYHQPHHPVTTTTQMTTSMENRSLSLPDMKSFAARAQAEEGKRKKRLARNRASARLRRLRKKNLVDSYEGEVGVLETSLQKLVAHEWGTHHEALLEALSMERGQQVISPEQRTLLIKEILQQQRSQVEWIQACQLEQFMLKQTFCESKQDDEDDEETRALQHELQHLLNLSEQQVVDLQHATMGLETELDAVDTMDECLKAMQDKEWLLNEGVTTITSQFTNILHVNQISKFLSWADGNNEAVESLDYCHAPSATSPPSASPVFCFGMDLGESHNVAMYQNSTTSAGNMMGDEE